MNKREEYPKWDEEAKALLDSIDNFKAEQRAKLEAPTKGEYN